METIIETGLAALELPTGAAEKLALYGEKLLRQNQVMNLTAITDPEQVARGHMLDCAAVAAHVPLCGKRLLDVGTGAGFPGLVLKLIVPDCAVTLVDSLEKRVRWLAEVAPELGAADTVCLHARAEELGQSPDYRERFDVVTSRAVADLGVLAELCLPFVKVGGIFVAMKSVESGPEVDAAGRAISILGGQLLPAVDYRIPGTDVVHRLVRVKKVRPTPPQYPRRFAKIKKAPLHRKR